MERCIATTPRENVAASGGPAQRDVCGVEEWVRAGRTAGVVVCQ